MTCAFLPPIVLPSFPKLTIRCTIAHRLRRCRDPRVFRLLMNFVLGSTMDVYVISELQVLVLYARMA